MREITVESEKEKRKKKRKTVGFTVFTLNLSEKETFLPERRGKKKNKLEEKGVARRRVCEDDQGKDV